MLRIYYPEMREVQPECDIRAKRMFGNTHYVLWTDVNLKGRGIESKGIQKDGSIKYIVTKNVFKKLCEQYEISLRELLD